MELCSRLALRAYRRRELLLKVVGGFGSGTAFSVLAQRQEGTDQIAVNTIEEAIFHAASELQGAQERTAFLERACGADPALRARIEALLEADNRARQFLADDPFGLGPDASPRPSQASAPPEETPGMLIGRYKLLQKIGEGGMGVVYMAEQDQPVRRKVALKVIKLGMDTKQVIARLEAERQAPALMDHPNIARVLDGGATAELAWAIGTIRVSIRAPPTWAGRRCAAIRASLVAQFQSAPRPRGRGDARTRAKRPSLLCFNPRPAHVGGATQIRYTSG